MDSPNKNTRTATGIATGFFFKKEEVSAQPVLRELGELNGKLEKLNALRNDPVSQKAQQTIIKAMETIREVNAATPNAQPTEQSSSSDQRLSR